MGSSEEDIATFFFSACQSGNSSKLADLLDREPYAKSLIEFTNDPNDPRCKKVAEKTIYTVALRGHYDALQVLMKAGANPNAQTSLGTPIYAAVKSGSLDAVRYLIKHGAKYKNLKGGFSPLYVACIEGRLPILRYLVSMGADIFSFTNPPLVFTACTAGQLDVLRYLMEEMEWDIHKTLSGENGVRTDGKDTLLYCACQRNKLDIAGFLVRHGGAITRTISTRFPQIIKHILQQRFRPLGPATPTQMYHAKLKELGLAELPWSIMADYANTIVRLELRENTLSALPQQVFKMPALKILDVSNNQLAELCPQDVEWQCESLTDLDVSHNQLSSVPSGLFGLVELSNLHLSYNLLTYLPGDPEDTSVDTAAAFPPSIRWTCDKLKKLDLSHNRLRSLPDTFDDLKRLSVMNLSHNYLKELPQSCSWGCVNLVHLDVAHNQLTDLPIGAANYWMHSLERLYFSHNKVSEISRNLTELNYLTTLDLSYNMIKNLPPTADWTGSRLSKLNLSFNQLTRLSHDQEEQQKSLKEQEPVESPRHPSAVGRFLGRTGGGLRGRRSNRPRDKDKLSVSDQEGPPPVDDQPRELPVELWNSSLQSLFVQGNQIKWLPDYLGKLSGLQRLDISGNTVITSLPLTLGMLRNCWEITLNGLRITNAPQHLLPGSGRGSTRHLLAYLRAQLRHCVPYNRMKLMVVGLQGRGKTTLLSVLRTPNAPLPENVSTVGVVVNDWTVQPPRSRSQKQPQTEVVFSIWDMAGQEVYYATHQCFLSRNTLYLVVWSMEEGDKGVDYLKPWLLNIQARAPHSPVIIVGTHLDKLPAQKLRELKDHYKQRIVQLYRKPGYPQIESIRMVSCVTQEGIRDLTDRIYSAAVNAIDHDTKEHVIGMQVPSSYVALQKKVSEEVMRCREKEIPPVLNQKEFASLAESIENNDIADPEELSLAASFLHDNGVLLHYNDHLRGLNNLYFIDPIWLADMLAEVVTVPERHSFVHNGILKESNVAFIFRDNKRFPAKFFQQYLQLLERFEIALSLGNGQRLIPSMLPFQRPIMNFVDPTPTVRRSSDTEEKSVLRRDIVMESSCSPASAEVRDPLSPRFVDGMEVMDDPLMCVRRRYKMAYIPSGFWSRLISRLIINLKRSGLEESANAGGGAPIIYWKRGIVVLHSTGRFLVESIQSASSELSGVSVGEKLMESSAKYVGGDGADKHTAGVQGVDITVWSDCGDFSAMGYVVDQLDSLIDEWFPGLNELDVEGEWLVLRQVMWKVPQSLVDKSLRLKTDDKGGAVQERKKRSWTLTDTSQQQRGEMIMFDLDACAADALKGDTILSSDYKVHIPLAHLVPDLLLTDLPPQLRIDTSQFEFNPKDPANRLGRGGAGAVYKGRYKHEAVAIKEFLTSAQAEHTGDTLEDQRSHHSEDDDIIRQEEALFLFRDLRQEVTVLAQLNHPNIVSLLGVCFHPMCMVIELAPMGSLFGILDKRIEQFKAAQADKLSVILRMPGGVLGHEISTHVALQVALALRYLHKHGVVYRDLKSDNVLIWSLDPEEPINAKLADYGISRFANPGGVKGEEGTPGYLAPEAIRRRGEDQAFDEKVDIFSYAMLLFELLTGERPFENLTSTAEINQAITKGDRPCLGDANGEPSFPAMIDLMYDCWVHAAGERPSANELVLRVSEPGFMCRQQTITRSKDLPLEKIDTIYARPLLAADESCDRKSYALWTWARQDADRNFSIIDVRKGVFNLPKKHAPGGRVYSMTATGEVEKRIWIGTADCEIQVYGYKGVGDPQCLWTFSMKDSVLALDTELEGGKVKRVFASLANGTLCVFSRKSISSQDQFPSGDAKIISEACTIKCDEDKFRQEAEDWARPLILRLGESGKAAKCMTFVGGKQLWCGCGNTITVIDSRELKVLHQIPVFVKRMALVNELVSDGLRVWGVGRQLSCVMEWDVETYTLLHVFNCTTIDPTDENIISDPKLVEDLFDPDSRPKANTVSEGNVSPRMERREGFNVENDPVKVQATGTPFSQRTTRCTLRGVKNITPRERVKNMKESKGSIRKRIATSRELVLRKHQGSTRTTSLVIIGETLWVARGMGDVLVVDVAGGPQHGKVLARLSTEQSEKFGNRSYNKLVSVAGEYVVSSQWLEPVDRKAPRGKEAQATTHQAITIWKAWSHKKIADFMSHRSAMLMMEDD